MLVWPESEVDRQDVLSVFNFWFHDEGAHKSTSQRWLAQRRTNGLFAGLTNVEFWFKKSAAVDRACAAFTELALAVAANVDRRLRWSASAKGAFALVILLDQLPRNIFRGTADMFAFDEISLQAARICSEPGAAAALGRTEMMFVIVALSHAEDMPTQEKAMHLHMDLVSSCPTSDEDDMIKAEALRTLPDTTAHAVLIERFGRFPHRNALLGRDNTEEETVYLNEAAQPEFAKSVTPSSPCAAIPEEADRCPFLVESSAPAPCASRQAMITSPLGAAHAATALAAFFLIVVACAHLLLYGLRVDEQWLTRGSDFFLSGFWAPACVVSTVLALPLRPQSFSLAKSRKSLVHVTVNWCVNLNRARQLSIIAWALRAWRLTAQLSSNMAIAVDLVVLVLELFLARFIWSKLGSRAPFELLEQSSGLLLACCLVIKGSDFISPLMRAWIVQEHLFYLFQMYWGFFGYTLVVKALVSSETARLLIRYVHIVNHRFIVPILWFRATERPTAIMSIHVINMLHFTLRQVYVCSFGNISCTSKRAETLEAMMIPIEIFLYSLLFGFW